jgi:thiosulfate/3-mercaptopyruvate sulfurtransferase
MTNIELPPPIVGSNWLLSQIAQRPDDVITCDVRSTMSPGDPKDDYLSRHLPGAQLVSLDYVLAVEAAGIEGRHPLPTPAAFAEALGMLGIGNDATVVAYDNQGGAFAGRLVWMLRIIGQPAALLDGGIDCWDGQTETGPVARESVDRETIEWPLDAIADADQVVDHNASGAS